MSGGCFLCIHGEAWPEVSESDTIPLCNSHWSRWVVRFVNSDDLPPCGAEELVVAGEQLHYVTLIPNGDGASSISFECKGGRDASCHNYPDCECEYWDDQHDTDHPSTPHDDCWMKDWFENEVGTRYDGENADDMHDNGVPAGLAQSGPIRASYEYEGCVSWVFA